ncbi:MAG: helix-turn-helix domain-containing protein [Bacteroidota bacterium]
MQHFSTLESYCQGIHISKPQWAEFDIRRFEDNMKTVHPRMPQFKHEFYAIALKIDGGGFTSTGNYSTKDLRATVFFNSPYQIISWDIAPDWTGYYVIFSEAFYKRNLSLHGGFSRKRIIEDFPFLLIDNTVPMPITAEEMELYTKLYADMHSEFQLNENHGKTIIASYLNILLLKVDRLYKRTKTHITITQDQRAQDLNTVSRFKTLLELSFQPGKEYSSTTPHQVQFYADKLNLHPNHFNAVVKRITDSSASEHIYRHILSLAQTLLRNTPRSIKEIAFELYYEYPNHFSKFFKIQTGKTPNQFRKEANSLA